MSFVEKKNVKHYKNNAVILQGKFSHWIIYSPGIYELFKDRASSLQKIYFAGSPTKFLDRSNNIQNINNYLKKIYS